MEAQMSSVKKLQNLCSIDFGEFVRTLDNNVQKSLLSRRNRQLMREKHKATWLLKSKIIPPTFSKLSKQNYAPSSPCNHIHAKTFHSTNQLTANSQKRIDSHYFLKNKPNQRKQCKTCHDSGRNAEINDRTKTNWRLQFRKDQLNILKYIRTRIEEYTADDNCQQTSQKHFKVRKVHKKFEQIRPQIYQIYKTNIDIVDDKERATVPLKDHSRTQGCLSLHRSRYAS